MLIALEIFGRICMAKFTLTAALSGLGEMGVPYSECAKATSSGPGRIKDPVFCCPADGGFRKRHPAISGKNNVARRIGSPNVDAISNSRRQGFPLRIPTLSYCPVFRVALLGRPMVVVPLGWRHFSG